MNVSLREITKENLQAVMALKVSPEQKRFVASNAVSIAEASVYAEAWPRAIYADETPVGFLMLHDENLENEPEQRDFYALWRLMIDHRRQGQGYATAAMKLLVEHIKSNPNAKTLLTSYVPGDGCPEGFYRKFGFKHTGKEVHGETEMALEIR